MTENDLIGLDVAWCGTPYCVIGPAVSTQSLDYSWFGVPVVVAEAVAEITADVPAGMIDFSSAAISTGKSATASIGLLDLLGVEPVVSQPIAVPPGSADLIGVAPDADKDASVVIGPVSLSGIVPATAQPIAVSTGNIDLLGVTPVLSQQLAVVVGLLDLLGISPDTNKDTPVVVGPISLLGVAPTTDKDAPVVVGLLDLLGVTPTAAQPIAVSTGNIDLLGVAPAADKDAPVVVGLLDLLGVTPTAAQPIAVSTGNIDLLGVEPTADKDAPVVVGLLDLLGIPLESEGIADVPNGLLDLLGVTPATAQPIAVSTGNLELLGTEATVTIFHFLPPGIVELKPVDATVAVAVAASSDDGIVSDFFGVIPDGTALIANSDSDMYLRFPSVGIAQGTSVMRVTLTCWTPDWYSADPGEFTVQAYDEDDATIPVSTVDHNSRALTTASVNWSPPSLSADEAVTLDVTSVIQEVVDRAGFTETSAILLVVKWVSGTNMQLSTIDATPSRPAELGFLVAGIPVATAKSAGLDAATAEVTALAPTAVKSTGVSTGNLDLLGTAVTTTKTAGIAVGVVELAGLAPMSLMSVAVASGSVDLTGIAPTTTKSASVATGILSVQASVPDAVQDVLLSLQGHVLVLLNRTLEIAPAEPSLTHYVNSLSSSHAQVVFGSQENPFKYNVAGLSQRRHGRSQVIHVGRKVRPTIVVADVDFVLVTDTADLAANAFVYRDVSRYLRIWNASPITTLMVAESPDTYAITTDPDPLPITTPMVTSFGHGRSFVPNMP